MVTLFDGICGAQVETVDASLGVMGFMGAVGIMGNIGASLNSRLGLHVAVVMVEEVQSRPTGQLCRTRRTCLTCRTKTFATYDGLNNPLKRP